MRFIREDQRARSISNSMYLWLGRSRTDVIFRTIEACKSDQNPVARVGYNDPPTGEFSLEDSVLAYHCVEKLGG